MPAKKRFLLRLDPELHRLFEKWAVDELRSVNAQMEFVLREAVHRAGRLPKKHARRASENEAE